ncbi:MAG: hypothetical protein CL677_10790 [Bdellovibrionaceae bacterium]|nr:hypothetical protein [Pseudobdellovibrionaceae bacterium]|tara:strand:- start:22842 stop:23174 length:333 start_codon:yes stop_codon:yes gene_type:complete
MSYIFHITEGSTWREQQSKEGYKPNAFEDEGFIHASDKSTVLGVYDRYYKNKSGLTLLVIDTGKLTSEVKREPTPNGEFPHIFGEINKDSIEAVLAIDSELGLAQILEKY